MNSEKSLVSFDEMIEKREQEVKLQREKKRNTIMNKIAQCAEKANVTLTQEVLEMFGDMVIEPQIKGAVAVTKQYPDRPKSIKVGNFYVLYKLEETKVDWGLPYVFSLWFVSEDKMIQMRKNRFERWCREVKGLPLSNDIASKISTEKDVHLHIFSRAIDFVCEVKKFVSEGEFLGQKVDEKLRFAPDEPIAYIVENNVYMSVPDWKYNRTDWNFSHH